MGLRIVLLLLFLVSSVVFFLVHQVTTIITVVNNHGDPPDPKNVGRYDDSVALNDQEGDIMSFVQISDLHISMFEDPQRYEQLNELCSINLKAINPKIVIASGDLTDSISPNRIFAQQYETEWKMYDEFHRRCRSELNVEWLDIRGNHDNFNIDGVNSSRNLYRKFGVQGQRKPGSYMVTVEVSNKTKYAFVAVDATLDVGPKRMLNFVGDLDERKMALLKDLDKSAAESRVNASIWFGHYPSSTIQSADPGLRQVAANGIAYLCGHLHTFLDYVTHMYAKHHSGLMELELGDWKQGRWYRVGVLDQGLFSFVDVRHKVWPIIVVTNPKPAFTVQPNKEPYHLVSSSTHIRIMIYSPSPIEFCEARIGNEEWRSCIFSGKDSPLYTLPWQPELYSSGLHSLQVRARDQSGSENQVEIQFSLDGSQPLATIARRIILLLDFTTTLRVLFGLAVAWCVVPLFIFRYAQFRIINRRMVMHRIKPKILRSFFRKLWMVANINGLFYPFSFYSAYLLFGPWFVGEILQDQIGVVFSWGTLLNNNFLPGSMSYFYGFLHVLTFNVPLLFILGNTADHSYRSLSKKRLGADSALGKCFKYLPVGAFSAFHLVGLIPFAMSYGTMAFLLCPMRTWAVALAIYLCYKASHLRKTHLRYVSVVWK